MAAVSGLFIVAAIVGGVVAVVVSISRRDTWAVVSSVVTATFGVLFWRWILLGAWLRVWPPEGVDPSEVDPVGPWGIVGRVLLALMVVFGVGLALWAMVVNSNAQEDAEKARDAAVRMAKDRRLTVDEVGRARSDFLRWSWDEDPREPNPYEKLLPLTEGEVADVAVEGDRASILIRLHDSPPCAVVDITHGDIIRGRITDRC